MKKSQKKSLVPKRFFLFLGISLFLWGLTTLSQEYQNTLRFPIVFENLPTDKLIQESPQEQLAIHVNGTGFKLISNSIFRPTISLDASALYQASTTKHYVLLNQQRLHIQKQMGSGLTIDHFIQDSVFLNLGYLSYKKVPVKPNVALEFESGFDFSSPLKLSPDSVMVTGPEFFIDTLQFVSTQKLQLKQVNTPLQKEVTLQSFSEIKNTSISTKHITISADIEEFTEGTLEVPFTLINVPENAVLNTFPKRVVVSYKVALSKFNSINPASFEIVCDYQHSLTNGLSYLIPKMISKSPLVKSVNMLPKTIDYIIEK